ncbi:MAG TPA: class I SAM-dependent methyltransferase [Mycobacterium sp.]|nr:class I SAM-dependent methyltransferase [Mycobacterium sp.]
MVAAGRARATKAALLDDRFAEPLVRAVGVDFFTRWATGELAAADVDVPGAPWGMQPMTDLLTARTRYFDDFLADAAGAGLRQVVILASGLDARGYRLTWPKGTMLFEIDQPAVLAFKAATLADLKAAPTADVRVVPIDLRHDWPAALRDAGFDAAKPAAWIAEGLLPFLPSDAQDRLLDNITALSADGSRLASEVATDGFDGDDMRESIEVVTQRWRDEGFDIELGELGYSDERNDVARYLESRGWQSAKTNIQQLLAEAGLPSMPLVDGSLAIGNNYYCTSIKR